MGSFTRSTASSLRLVSAKASATSYVERIAEDAEQAADAADQVRVKAARHGKAERRLGRGGAR